MSNFLSQTSQQKIDEIVNQTLLKVDKIYPDNPLEDIVESYGGIEVLELDFEEDSEFLLGAVSYPNGDTAPRIFINKDLTPERKTFTLAHEFGHYLMHKGKAKLRLDFVEYDGSKEAQEETEANYFAATLLMPKEKFVEIYTLLGNEKLVAEYFGVSVAAVRNRKTWIDKN